MRFENQGAQRASTPHRPHTSPLSTRSLGAAARIGIALAVAIAAPFAMPTSPASAAQCGTQWGSRSEPPNTIRVYRESRERVDVVDFQAYVEVVMTVEWPYWLPREVLEAGAVAVKQFAWYHALDGHHRSWYVTPSGECYDVVDTHMDQIYKPERADIHDRQVEAVQSTWAISLRQEGHFFLTQYRSGESGPCGNDSNSRILYARSAIDCAKDGKASSEILGIYYGPNMALVGAGQDPSAGQDDGTPPDVTKPKVVLRAGAAMGGQNATVSWSATDASGIDAYQLQRRVDLGGWRDVELGGPKATHADVSLATGHKYAFHVRARDGSGGWSNYVAVTDVRANVIEGGDATMRGDGWKADRDQTASGGVTRFSRVDAASASLTFTGRGVAFVAPRDTDRGKVDILMDGDWVETIDLAAAAFKAQRIVFVRNWAKAAEHTIRVVVRGSKRVDVDAFLVLK